LEFARSNLDVDASRVARARFERRARRRARRTAMDARARRAFGGIGRAPRSREARNDETTRKQEK
jgi:hypothetical protein